MPQSTLEALAVGLLAFFTAGWSVLAGADLGLGMVLPFLARDARERRLTLAALFPFFLGNEVWLIAAVGVFTGCFTALEGEVFQGQTAALLPLLAGWVLRDTGLWWHLNLERNTRPPGQSLPRFGPAGPPPALAGPRSAFAGPRPASPPAAASHGRPEGRGIGGTGWLVTTGSWTVVLSWGWLLAALSGGHPGDLATGPAALAAALLTAALFAAHGLAFGAVRLRGRPRERARRPGRLSGPEPGAGAETLHEQPYAAGPTPPPGPDPTSHRARRARWAFAATAVATAAVPLAAGARLPLAEAAARGPEAALLVPALLAVLPLLLAAQVWMWRAFTVRPPGPRPPGLHLPEPTRPGPLPADPGGPVFRPPPGPRTQQAPTKGDT